MPLPLEERDEILVCNDNQKLMIELRHKIAAKFPRVWIIVHHDMGVGLWGIEVSNNYGHHLLKEKREEVEEFIEEFMLNYHSSLEEEVDNTKEDD